MSGYSEGGASRDKNTLKTWSPLSLSPKRDIDYNLATLRNRSRDLARNSAIGAAVVNTFSTNVIGEGLQLFPRPDAQLLGLSSDAARNWSKTVKREFALWARECDFLRRNNFAELQQIAFSNSLVDGDCFCLLRRRDSPRYTLRLQLIEAGRVSTPNGIIELPLPNGRIVNGIETDDDGILTACHISNRLFNEPDERALTWQRVKFFGEESGLRNVLQICRDERPEQFRGVPILAPVIEALKQISRYSDAELTSSIIKSFFSVFFVQPASNFNLQEITGEELDVTEYKLGSGTISALPKGVDVKAIDAQNSQNVFDSFMTHFIKQVAAGVGLPYEVLMKTFNSSYSASRAALLQASSEYKRRKAAFIRDFCQPIYEQWLLEAVGMGRIDAAGFDDPIKRAAWSNAAWFNQTSRILDPMKETQSMILRLHNGLSTYEREVLEATGEDFAEVVEQLAAERKLLQAIQ